jgi:DNA-binding NarL/FixJ family response regulator
MGEKIRLVLVDDNQYFREGLKKVLQASGSYEIIAEASNGIEFLDLINSIDPDIILMDISMPLMDGIEATQKTIEKRPNLKIIVLSMYDDQVYYYRMIQAGVKGFLLKTSDKSEIEHAIHLVYEENCYFSNDLLKKININYTNSSNQLKVGNNQISLTKVEIDILEFICKGFSANEIADHLNLEVEIINANLFNLLKKTGSKTEICLIMFAIKNKLVEIIHTES